MKIIIMNPDSYSVKEMISEFRLDVKDSFSVVHKRLDAIDNKQAIANGRTGKLEAKQKAYIMVVGVLWAITLAVGGLFARLYVADVARAIVIEQKELLIKQTTEDILSTLNQEYNLELK